MEININGKSFSSLQEWADYEKHNPESTTIIWEYQQYQNIVMSHGKITYPDGKQGKGKCWYRDNSYEGEIEYRNNCLYVGGEFVKSMD